jgi:hypothetical protein
MAVRPANGIRLFPASDIPDADLVAFADVDFEVPVLMTLLAVSVVAAVAAAVVPGIRLSVKIPLTIAFVAVTTF